MRPARLQTIAGLGLIGGGTVLFVMTPQSRSTPSLWALAALAAVFLGGILTAHAMARREGVRLPGLPWAVAAWILGVIGALAIIARNQIYDALAGSVMGVVVGLVAVAGFVVLLAGAFFSFLLGLVAATRLWRGRRAENHQG